MKGTRYHGFGWALRMAFGGPEETSPEDEDRVISPLESAGELRQAAEHLSRVARSVAPEVGFGSPEKREDGFRSALQRLTEGMRGS